VNRLRLITAMLALGALSGCANMTGYGENFSCPDVEYGSPCMSAREVYMSNGTDTVAGSHAEHAAGTGNGGAREIDTRISRQRMANSPPMPGLDGPKPLRTPARVMRIYIAPWVSVDGALTMPSYVFTEIEPRRWSVGERAPSSAGGSQNFYPLQVGKRAKDGRGSPKSSNRGPAAQ